jgi:V/A-type H+-transporting ATPase subunit I
VSFDLPFDEVQVPAAGLRELGEETERIKGYLADLEGELQRFAAQAPLLKKEMDLVQQELGFIEIVAGMGREGTISYLQGYCPVHDLKNLQEEAGQHAWGLMVEEPSNPDHVPTLIKNPPWIRIIEPVFRFLGTVPGYHEFDVSFWFLISLGLFFAMLVGDGGYGLIFLLGTILARQRFRSARGEPFSLLYVFSGATIFWGLITGNWFGVKGLAQIPFLERFVLPELYSYADNQAFMMQLCFTLGFTHLTAAHLIRTFRYAPSIRALGEIGWILILGFLFFLASHLVLARDLPRFSFCLLLSGFLLSGLFSNPGKSVIKSSIQGLADLPLKIISAFSDLVSYLRLFAVGYATLIVAVSFNQMAFSLGGHPFLRVILGGGLLLLGHAINIALAIMAVLVHGIRLNMLEFSIHLGMNWSGRAYRPFKSNVQSRTLGK